MIGNHYLYMGRVLRVKKMRKIKSKVVWMCSIPAPPPVDVFSRKNRSILQLAFGFWTEISLEERQCQYRTTMRFTQFTLKGHVLDSNALILP